MKYVTVGDPHLGRKFRTGVPLHRIGDREAMVWAQFEKELKSHDGDIHINMGDLFDKFVVSPEVVLRAADLYLNAAKNLPSCRFYVLRGNHDASKDTTKRSSFDIFTQLVAGAPNISVVSSTQVVDGTIGLVGYDPFVPVVDQIEELPDELDVVYMHHDFVDFGGDHVIPTELLARRGIFKVVNGHDHLKRTEKRHGVTVELTGSMQPYTHAEDDTGDWYQTHTLETIPGDCTNLNIRVLLTEGEILPEDLDCLSLIGKRVVEGEQDLEVDTTEFDTFDIHTALSEAVHPEVRALIMEKFDAA